MHACCDTVSACQSFDLAVNKQQFTEAIALQSVLMVPLRLLQVADQLPRRHKDPASLLAAGKWISAPELV